MDTSVETSVDTSVNIPADTPPDAPVDVISAGLLVADMPLLVPYDVIDFRTDSIRLDDVQILTGGDAANTAIALAYLGKKTILSAKVGCDHFGAILKDKLRAAGVGISMVVEDASTRTGISVVLINAQGERTFLHRPGNNRAFGLDDIDLSALKRAKHINLGSLLSLPKLDGAGAAELFREAHSLGLTTSADVACDQKSDGFSRIQESLRYVDYFMPSLSEARFLSGETEIERMADFFIRETGDKCVVIKLGGEGCFVKSQGGVMRIPAYNARAVDTTGAGDSFVAGFLFGLTSGWELEQCADFGNAVAAFSVQYVGATSSAMNLASVEAFMRTAGHK